jgi:small conductance mechanosensitive channel
VLSLALAALLIAGLIMAGPGLNSTPATAAEGGAGAAAAASRKNWWDLDRARRCGRMWCSRVVTPHIPLAPGEPKLTLAVPGGAAQAEGDPAARVEARSTAVATTLKRLSAALADRGRSEPDPVVEKGAAFWWQRRKARHPSTPRLAIGTKNNSPVIYLPADGARGTPQVTLVTLTEPDALANRSGIEGLAGDWREILENTLSESLWSASFDRRFPWARWLASLGVIVLGGAGVALFSELRQRIAAPQRQRRLRLRQLHAQQRGGDAHADDTLRLVQRIERRRAAAALLLKILAVLRIAVAVMALIIVLYLFPATRLASAFLLFQSAGLPLIWVGMIALEALLGWAMRRRLNHWALDAQVEDPTSTRPKMRLETNIRVLGGSIGVGTTVLGLYLTLLLFGINPQILAGAGILAVAVGFLARSLVEDLISGILILSGDRFAIGDSIQVNDQEGLVEGMNLAITQLRGGDGELITIPNGTIRVVENRSKDWARVNFETTIAWGADLERACALLEQVAGELRQDPEWKDLILEEPQMLGVERLERRGVRLKLWIRTLPLKQWSVGREYRRRLKHAFDAEGIEPGYDTAELLQGARPRR